MRTVDVSANPRDGAGSGGGGAPDYTIDDVMFHHPVTAGQSLTAVAYARPLFSST